MGDIADMMLEGILDANGEYTGINPGHPVYPKGWFGEDEKQRNMDRHVQISNFLKQRGVTEHAEQKEILHEFAKHLGTDFKRITRRACSDWKVFKAFVDNKIGFVKPSKIAN